MVSFLIIIIFLIVIWLGIDLIGVKLEYNSALYKEQMRQKEEEIKFQWEYINKLQKQVHEIIVLHEKHKGE